MFGRGPFFLLLLVAAFFVPYFLSESGTPHPLSAWWDSLWTDSISDRAYPIATASPLPRGGTEQWAATGGATSDLTAYSAGTGGLPIGTTPGEWRTVRVLPQGVPHGAVMGGGIAPPRHAGPIVQNGSDLIRFDLRPDWIVQQWPRVSTHLREGNLRGLRVAMVSGTGLRDLAGSLTYYFDSQNDMQRLVFDGSTGDPAYLIQDLSKRFGLRPEPSLGNNVLVSRADQRISGWLNVSPAAIVRSSQPYQRYDVQLDLARPGSNVPLTSRFIPRSLLVGDKGEE